MALLDSDVVLGASRDQDGGEGTELGFATTARVTTAIVRCGPPRARPTPAPWSTPPKMNGYGHRD